MKKNQKKRTYVSLTAAIAVLSALAFILAAHPAFCTVDAPDMQRKTHGAFKKARFRTAFDMAHSEIFSPLVKEPLHYSAFYESFVKHGGTASVNGAHITAKILSNYDVYVVAGPAARFSADEIDALEVFVKNGGNLLVLLHISQPVAELTERLGIIATNYVISERTGLIEGESQNFYVTRLTPHPVIGDIKTIAVFGTWGLMAQGSAKIVARTSDEAWADINRNRAFDKGEPVQSFGIIGVNEVGNGKVVVVADDAPFTNRFRDAAQNKALAENIINWFKGGR